MMKIFLCFLTIAVFHLQSTHGLLREFIQNNVAGPPVNFKSVAWPIDPDAGIRRRTEYEDVNGHLGARHIERIGLGEDGRTEERRAAQNYRDSIGALSLDVPDT